MKSSRQLLSAALWFSIVAVEPATASTVNYYDGTFDNLTFVKSTSTRTMGFGPTELTTITGQVITGNLDSVHADPNAISIGFNWSGPPSPNTLTGGVVVLDNKIVYDPSTQGAIANLSLSENKMSPGTGTIPASPARFVAFQNGNYFLYVTGLQTGVGGQYTNYSTGALTASNFTQTCLVNCGAGHFGDTLSGSLDFSANGGAITFGLFVIDRNGSTGPRSSTVFFDNYSLEVNNVTAAPEPSTWAMMMFGFAGLSLLAYRKRQNLRTALT